MRTRFLLLAILSFVYWAVRRLLELLVLCQRGERAKEVEILVSAMSCMCSGGRSLARGSAQPIALCWRR